MSAVLTMFFTSRTLGLSRPLLLCRSSPRPQLLLVPLFLPVSPTVYPFDLPTLASVAVPPRSTSIRSCPQKLQRLGMPIILLWRMDVASQCQAAIVVPQRLNR
ncbi:MAG: hypothetical protein Q9201_003286 [Fulgogasparrea decipioides]